MARTSPTKCLVTFLRSKKLALFTIGLLTLFSVVGMIGPQGNQEVFTSWWFVITAILFFVNLFLCTIAQIFDAIKKGFRWGVFGRILLHIGLILIVLGGFLTGAFKTTGYMMLGEGETKKEKHQYYKNIKEGSFFREDMHEGFDITLLKQNVVFDSAGKVDYIQSLVEVKDDRKTLGKHWVEKGLPLRFNNYRFFHYNAGYAPAVVIKDSGGKQIFGTYLMLNVEQEGEGYRHYVSGQPLPGTPYYVDFEYYPDAKVSTGQITSLSEVPNNPLAMVTIYKGKDRVVGQGRIGRNMVVSFEGNTMQMASEFKRWVGLEIVNDPGAPILFIGCWVTLLGAVLFFGAGMKLRFGVKEA